MDGELAGKSGKRRSNFSFVKFIVRFLSSDFPRNFSTFPSALAEVLLVLPDFLHGRTRSFVSIHDKKIIFLF